MPVQATRPKPPPRGYPSWPAFEADVVCALRDVRALGHDHEATVVVLAHAQCAGRESPALSEALRERMAEPDGAALKAALDKVAGWHAAWSRP